MKEDKGIFLMKVPQWCVFNRLMDAATQSLDCDQNSPNFELKTWFLAWKNVKTLTHSHQQPQGPKAPKKKSTIRLTYRAVFCVLQWSLFTGSSSWMKSSAQHTLSNKAQLKNLLRLANLTENDAQHTFKLLVRLLYECGLAMDFLF